MTASDRELVITRVFDAPRDLVWKAWTDPERIKQWSAPKGFTIPVAEGELRPGTSASIGSMRFSRKRSSLQIHGVIL